MSDEISQLVSASDNWDAMTRQQRAVAVASDVQYLLKIKKIDAMSGVYLNASVHCKPDDDLRQVLSSAESCRVCAVGAMFVAKIAARNGADVQSHCRVSEGTIRAIESDSLRESLAEAFERNTLRHIEDAFEEGWKNQYASDCDRLNAIMQQVIDGDGEFTSDDADKYGVWDEANDYDYGEDDYDDDWDYYDEDDDDWEDDEDL